MIEERDSMFLMSLSLNWGHARRELSRCYRNCLVCIPRIGRLLRDAERASVGIMHLGAI